MADILERWRTLPGRNTEAQVTHGGTLLHAQAGGGSAAGPLAFYRVFAEGGNWILQGGQVMGGAGNQTVDNITLAAVGSEPADGTDHWLEITGNGVTDAGVLLAGYDVTAAVAGSGASIPANTLPTATIATARKVYVLLGTWAGDVFSPSQGGNVGVTFCPGGYTITRGS